MLQLLATSGDGSAEDKEPGTLETREEVRRSNMKH